MVEEAQENSHYYAIRTAPGREDKFLDALSKTLEKREDHGVKAVFKPQTVKGYVFSEAESLSKLVDIIRNVPNNKGVIKTPLPFEELEKYFEKEGEKIVVNERDLVEVISGPFKGDRAQVVRVVPGKDEVVIEPTNMTVPIPVTLSLDDIRVIDAKGENNNE